LLVVDDQDGGLSWLEHADLLRRYVAKDVPI
jgi:hypothetical protein